MVVNAPLGSIKTLQLRSGNNKITTFNRPSLDTEKGSSKFHSGFHTVVISISRDNWAVLWEMTVDSSS